MSEDTFRIADEAQLEALIGEPMEFVKAKVGPSLNMAMKRFIAASPLAFISTEDEQGRIDVSPKGDPAGFVEVDEGGNLLIPERIGNKLMFGFRNILRNGKIGLIFAVPNQLETLRVKGVATLHHDPAILETMAVKGKPALLYTRVEVTECFFHCGKALIRSDLWKPDRWQTERKSIAAQQMAGQEPSTEERIRQTEAALQDSYANRLY